MNGRNLVIVVLLVFVMILSGLGYVFWWIWNGENSNENNTALTSHVLVVKRIDLEEVLIKELENQKGDLGYKTYRIDIAAENDLWIRGLLLAYRNDKREPPTDPYEFLAKKNIDGDVIRFEYIYSEGFRELLEEVPQDILPQEAKAFYY